MNERKEKGFVKMVAKGNWAEILGYFKVQENLLNVLSGGPFKWELEALNDMKGVLKENTVEKIQKRGLLLYYLPHLNKGHYELYVTSEITGKIKMQSIMNDPKRFLKKANRVDSQS